MKSMFLGLVTAGLLAACGGGGDSCPVPGGPGGGDSGLPDGPTESINHNKPKPAPTPAPAPSEPSC